MGFEPDLPLAGIPHGGFQRADQQPADPPAAEAGEDHQPVDHRLVVGRFAPASQRHASHDSGGHQQGLGLGQPHGAGTPPAFGQEFPLEIARVPVADADFLPGKRPAAQVEPLVDVLWSGIVPQHNPGEGGRFGGALSVLVSCTMIDMRSDSFSFARD